MLFGINDVLEMGYELHFRPAAQHEFTLTVSRDGVEGQSVTDSYIHGCIEKLVKLGAVEVKLDAVDMLMALCKHSVRLYKNGDFYTLAWLAETKAFELSMSTDYLTVLVSACVDAQELVKSNCYRPSEGYSGGLLRERLDQGWQFVLQKNPNPLYGDYQVEVWRDAETLIGAGEGYAHNAIQNGLKLCEGQYVTPDQP